MSTNQTWNNLGTELRGAIQTALQTGDFKDFNGVVANAANEAVKETRDRMGQNTWERPENYTEKWLREHDGKSQPVKDTRLSPDEKWRPQSNQKWQPYQTKSGQANRQQSSGRQYTEKYLPAEAQRAPFNKVGGVSGTLLQVFGGIGAGTLAVLCTVFLGVGIGGGAWGAFGFVSGLLALSVGMVNVGTWKKRRLKRAQKYLELAGNNHYVNLEDIALHTGRDKKYVLKDIRKMLSDGFYPQGHLDRQESCLMLDDRIYGEYVKLEKQRRIQEQEQKAIPEKPQAAAGSDKAAPQVSQEVSAMIAEGADCIRKLRDMNDNIAGEAISAKLFRLETLLKEIFDRLKEHPEQAPQMQKFLNYYLPTTLKLVAAYEEFDELSEQGPDIVEAKEEIEKTLDTINGAFSELLNRLLRDTAYDVTTDAQVLQTMLAQEGLTREKEFEFADRK